MSESELVLTATANKATVTETLRDALDDIAKQLVAAGSAPPGLISMEWSAPDPAAFHPARHEVDLLSREAFAGFVPPITLKKTGNEFRVVARARVVPKPAAGLVYRDYDRAALTRQYSPRLQADFKTVCADWATKSAQFRKNHRGTDLRYGTDRFESLDLFYPQGVEKPPLFVFFHGGYWQALDKGQHSHFADGLLEAGFAVAMVNYGLAPHTSLETILDQCRQSLHFLAANADALGYDGNDIHIGGHSAGGQIAAMLASDPQAPTIRSALLISGVFDLEPLSMIPMGPLLGLDDRARMNALSPLHHTPKTGMRVGVAVGGAESEEFIRQSRELAAQWKTDDALIVENANHFTVLDSLNGGALLALACAIAKNEPR